MSLEGKRRNTLVIIEHPNILRVCIVAGEQQDLVKISFERLCTRSPIRTIVYRTRKTVLCESVNIVLNVKIPAARFRATDKRSTTGNGSCSIEDCDSAAEN